MQVVAIASNTMKEIIRSRILMVIVGFAVILLMSAPILEDVSLGQQSQIMMHAGIAMISFIATVVAIIIGGYQLATEINTRTLYTMLAKPISRTTFLIGKYLGIVAVEVVLIGGMTGVLYVMGILYGAHMSALTFLTAGAILIEVSVMSAVMLLLAVMTRPMISIVGGIAIFFAGHGSWEVYLAIQNPETAEGVRRMLQAVYYGMPNLDKLSLKTQLLYGITPSGAQLTGMTMYAVGYVIVMLALAAILFRREDF